MLEQSPWFGLGGTNHFQDALKEQAKQGRVSTKTAAQFGEPHNDVILMLAGYGLLGGIALVVVYIAPAVMFVRRFQLAEPDRVRAAAAMGLALTLGFAIFGMTELMFRGMRTVGMYSAILAWLIALCAPPPAHKRQKD